MIDAAAMDVMDLHVRTELADVLASGAMAYRAMANGQEPDLPSDRESLLKTFVFLEFDRFVEGAEADALGADGYEERERRGQFLIHVFVDAGVGDGHRSEEERAGRGDAALSAAVDRITAILRRPTVTNAAGALDLRDEITVGAAQDSKQVGMFVGASLIQSYVRYFSAD